MSSFVWVSSKQYIQMNEMSVCVWNNVRIDEINRGKSLEFNWIFFGKWDLLFSFDLNTKPNWFDSIRFDFVFRVSINETSWRYTIFTFCKLRIVWLLSEVLRKCVAHIGWLEPSVEHQRMQTVRMTISKAWNKKINCRFLAQALTANIT